jgi:exonuclease III
VAWCNTVRVIGGGGKQTNYGLMDNTPNRGKTNKKQLKSIRITSFNVRGLKNNIKRQRVLSYLKDKHPGILFLQETYTNEGDDLIWKKQWKGEIYMSHGTNHSKGVAILIPQEIDFTTTNSIYDPEGRYILLNGTFAGKEMTLLNCYAPTSTDVNLQKNYLNKILPPN